MSRPRSSCVHGWAVHLADLSPDVERRRHETAPHKAHVPLVKSKCAGKRFCIRCLEARETEDIPLVKLTPMVLEMGHDDLTNRILIGFRPNGITDPTIKSLTRYHAIFALRAGSRAIEL